MKEQSNGPIHRTSAGAHTELGVVPVDIHQTGKPNDSWSLEYSSQKSLSLIKENNQP